MAWTATLTSKTRDALGRVTVVVELTNGTVTEGMTLTTDSAPSVSRWLERQVKARVAQLDALDAWSASLPAAGQPVDLTVSTDPTAAEVAEQQWVTDYRRKLLWDAAIAAGFESNTDAQYVALRNKVQTNWKRSYIDYVR